MSKRDKNSPFLPLQNTLVKLSNISVKYEVSAVSCVVYRKFLWLFRLYLIDKVKWQLRYQRGRGERSRVPCG